MTPEQRIVWFPQGQSQGRSAQELALPEYMWSVLDRVRAGIDPLTNTKIDARRMEELMRIYLPIG